MTSARTATPAGCSAHVNQLKGESPSVWSDVKALHDRIISDANANASPPGGFTVKIDVASDGTAGGHVGGIGVKGGGDWIDDFDVTVELTGPGTLDATGTKTWSGRTQNAPRTLNWTRSGPGRVSVTATVSGLPSRQYERWWGGGNTQHIFAAADLVSVSDSDHVVDETVAQQFLPLSVVKSAEGHDPAGLVGVGIAVHAGDPAGPVVDAHTFTAADVGPDGTAGVTFAASPAGCTAGCKYDPEEDYYVVITAEPAGWVPTATVVQADLSQDGHALGATLSDSRYWTPSLVTQVSDQLAVPGATLHDVVTVTDTGGHATTGHWALLGPIPPGTGPSGSTCTGVDWSTASVAASGTFSVAGDGSYTVGQYVVQQPGCYTYVESADATPLSATIATTAPGSPSETALVAWTPSLTTRISHQQAEVGSTVSDTVVVQGTHGASVAGHWKLLGPVGPAVISGTEPRTPTTCLGLDWTNAPVAAQGDFTATGDGSYQVGSHHVTVAGCYTYVEQLDATSTTAPVPWTAPGDMTETGIFTQAPTLVTRVSDQLVRVGATITDQVTVSGTGGATVTGRWSLLGPVQPRKQPSCRGLDWSDAAVAASGTFTATGDGTYTVGRFRVTEAGCYAYVEELAGTATTQPVPPTRPGIPAETTLVAPVQLGTAPSTSPSATTAVTVAGPAEIQAGGGAASRDDRWTLVLGAIALSGAGLAGAIGLSRRRLRDGDQRDGDG